MLFGILARTPDNSVHCYSQTLAVEVPRIP